jgi:hypothetical protein
MSETTGDVVLEATLMNRRREELSVEPTSSGDDSKVMERQTGEEAEGTILREEVTETPEVEENVKESVKAGILAELTATKPGRTKDENQGISQEGASRTGWKQLTEHKR